MYFLNYFFHWYDGLIWSNLLASVIWSVPAFVWGHRKFRQLHHKLDDHHAEHMIHLMGVRNDLKRK